MAVESKAVAERLVRELSPDDINTTRGDEDEESREVKASVTMALLKVLTAKVLWYVARSPEPSRGASRPEAGQPSSSMQMPALFIRTSRRPNFEEIKETALAMESSEVILCEKSALFSLIYHMCDEGGIFSKPQLDTRKFR